MEIYIALDLLKTTGAQRGRVELTETADNNFESQFVVLLSTALTTTQMCSIKAEMFATFNMNLILE